MQRGRRLNGGCCVTLTFAARMRLGRGCGAREARHWTVQKNTGAFVAATVRMTVCGLGRGGGGFEVSEVGRPLASWVAGVEGQKKMSKRNCMTFVRGSMLAELQCMVATGETMTSDDKMATG